MSITIKQGNILEFDGDYIVNAANSHLHHGGGVARAIANAATSIPNVKLPEHRRFHVEQVVSKWKREQEDHPEVPVGGACLTSAGLLPFKGIIHAVGPIWSGGDDSEEDLLWQAHRAALDIAIAESGEGVAIAFPAISCGIFGFPVERAASVALGAVEGADADVTFYLYGDKEFEAFSWVDGVLINE